MAVQHLVTTGCLGEREVHGTQRLSERIRVRFSKEKPPCGGMPGRSDRTRGALSHTPLYNTPLYNRVVKLLDLNNATKSIVWANYPLHKRYG